MRLTDQKTGQPHLSQDRVCILIALESHEQLEPGKGTMPFREAVDKQPFLEACSRFYEIVIGPIRPHCYLLLTVFPRDFQAMPHQQSPRFYKSPPNHTRAVFPRRQIRVWRVPGIKAPGPDEPPEYVPLDGNENPWKYRVRAYHPISSAMSSPTDTPLSTSWATAVG